MAAATATMNTVLSDAEKTITPVVKEVERTFLFTDVPCGAMKFTKDDDSKDVSGEANDDVTAGLLGFCGGLERAFCFSDLKDVDESDIERLKSMKSIEDNEASQKENEQPVVERADTESMSDTSEGKPVDPAIHEKNQVPVEPVAVATPVKAANDGKVNESPKGKVKEGKRTVTTLPPRNVLQASRKNVRDGKPTNALQAAKASKAAKKEAAKAAKKQAGKEKKKWSLFRRSSKAQV